jgi:hypothetical protein
MEKYHYLLFHNLPYDYKQELPIQLAGDVELVQPPHEILKKETDGYWNKEEYRSLVNSILPKYDLPNGGNHCCFRIKEPLSYLGKIQFRTLFFNNLTAFRLWKPLYIFIAGEFTYESEEEPIRNDHYHGMKSIWNPIQGESYTYQDIIMVNEIGGILCGDILLKYPRFNSALTLFSQITNGWTRSFQMAYLGLFAVLEGLFWYEGRNKGGTLSVRVSNFLSSVEWNHKFTLKDFVRNEYRTRNDITHGGYSVDPKVELSDEKKTCFGRLHEITRLCILGMLSLDEESLHSIFIQNGEITQKCLDTLEPAKGKYFNGQRLWLNQ